MVENNEMEKGEISMTEEKVEENADKVDIDLGSDKTFYIANNGNYFGIAFDKIFDNPALDVYNNFEMSSKRNFKNLSSAILGTYQDLFLDDEGMLKEEADLFLFNILGTKSEIMTADGTPATEFYKMLDKIITDGDNLLVKLIDDFVENNYALELDKATEEAKAKNKKINDELMFKDDHAKDLLKISYLYRVMIPIISSYFFYNKNSFVATAKEDDEDLIILENEDIDELKFDDVNSIIFKKLFEVFAKKPEALENKLYRLASSGVSKTAYSDKRFWQAAKNVGITTKTESLEIFKKILTNAIPKLSIDADKNVISFLQSVINNQVDFLFQNKFKYHYIPIGNNEGQISVEDNEDSNVTEFEKMEIQQSRKDEGSFLIRKMHIKEVLEKIPEEFDVGVSDAEVKEINSKITKNAIQEQIVSFLTLKYFKDKSAIKSLKQYQYSYLIVACKKFLLKEKYVYLPMILTAVCEKHRERLNISGSKVRPEILSSKKFTELINEKYPNVSEEIKKSILSFIGTVYSSVFKDENGDEIFDATVKVGKIGEEIINLAKWI